MLDPMSLRSMCGHDRLSSKASAPCSWHAFASVCQAASSLSLPEPAMIEAISIRSGYAFLMPAILGIHQSSGLSEISSQCQDECSAVSGFFCIDSWPSSVERRNLVFGPATFVTGWRPIVLVTTPPQPASKARMMLLSDSVGGAEDSRNGFANFRPVNVTEMSGFMGRIIGKTEGMPAIQAHVLGVAPAPGQELDEVPRNHANRGVADDLRIARRHAFGLVDLLEERMPAKARE